MTRKPRKQHGFSLLEMLVAIAIFSIGVLAIVSILPVGIILQRRAFEAITAKQVEVGATAHLKALKLPLGHGAPIDGLDDYATSGLILRNPKGDSVSGGSPLTPLNIHFDPDDTTYPATPDNKTFVWEYLFRNTEYLAGPPYTTDATKWEVIVCILRNEGADMLTEATGITTGDTFQFTMGVSRYNDVDNDYDFDRLRKGDTIIDKYGRIYTLKSVDQNTVTVNGVIFEDIGPVDRIWYAEPPALERPNPLERAYVLPGSEVILP